LERERVASSGKWHRRIRPSSGNGKEKTGDRRCPKTAPPPTKFPATGAAHRLRLNHCEEKKVVGVPTVSGTSL
jgi:hypothetical protein